MAHKFRKEHIDQRAGIVFIIEDDPGICDTIVRILEASAFNALAVDGIENSIDAIVSSDSPTIIIDLALGKTDAVEVLSRLAQAGAFCKVILISGHSLEIRQQTASVAREMGHNVLGSLAKPFRRKDLLYLLSAAPEFPLARLHAPDENRTVRALRNALEAGQLEFRFSPQIDLRCGQLRGVDVLAGVRDPQAVLLTSADIAEASREDKFSLACAAIEVVASVGEELRGRTLSLSINVSGSLWAADAIMRRLIEARDRLGDAATITIGLTETDIAGDVAAEPFCARAAIHGFDVSIDDFGTAYATFDRLRAISFKELTLKTTIVGAAATETRARSICRASAELAHACGAAAVADGVETLEDLALICSLGFDVAQGALFAQPMPRDELMRFLGDDGERIRIRDLVRKARPGSTVKPAVGRDRESIRVPSPPLSSDHDRRHVLLVEDDPFIAGMICSLWPNDDVQFSRATTLSDAIKKLREPPGHGFDAIILDLQLPDGNGLDILSNVRDLTDAAVIIISGEGTSESRADAIDAGVADYIMKPFSVRELKARLVRCMGKETKVDAADVIPISKEITLDTGRGMLASRVGQQALTNAETSLLRSLKEAAGHVATRDSLSRAVFWRDYGKQDKSLDVCVGKLRRKVATIDPGGTVRITAVRSLGYRLTVLG